MHWPCILPFFHEGNQTPSLVSCHRRHNSLDDRPRPTWRERAVTEGDFFVCSRPKRPKAERERGTPMGHAKERERKGCCTFCLLCSSPELVSSVRLTPLSSFSLFFFLLSQRPYDGRTDCMHDGGGCRSRRRSSKARAALLQRNFSVSRFGS